MTKPMTLCLAPWTHTYVSPQTERRMCCASREPAQNFTQYIDTALGTGSYKPTTLQEHWNGDHMRSVRRRMMDGQTLPECEVCNHKLLNTAVYKDYFWHLFQHKYNEIFETTDSTGFTTMLPVSWDYRFSNICNFKCRTCGDMLSSSWESEQKLHNMIDWSDTKNHWMKPQIKQQITDFQNMVVEKEFAEAVEQHRVEEIYWVGGEPLMYEQHWRYMKRIIELGDGQNVYARYNTNLSRVDYSGHNLYRDILEHIRDWQICASLDGTGAVGEYIRTGLDFEKWCRNFEQGLEHQRNPRQMRIDFTLTLPGLFELENIQNLANKYNVMILCKVIFSFSPDIVMSPLALPREILHPLLSKLSNKTPPGAIKDTLIELLQRPTFQEQWPDRYRQGLIKGKSRITKIEQVRKDSFTMTDILQQEPSIHEWWKNIGTD